MSMENPLTPAGIEPATFPFVAQHLNHCTTAFRQLNPYNLQIITTICSATAICNRKTSRIFNLHMVPLKSVHRPFRTLVFNRWYAYRFWHVEGRLLVNEGIGNLPAVRHQPGHKCGLLFSGMLRKFDG